MAMSISFRPSEDDLRNLAVLEASGLSRSQAIRSALASAAQRHRQQEALRREAEALAGDAGDRAEVAAVRAYFGDRFSELDA